MREGTPEIVLIKWRDASLHGQDTKWEDDLDEIGLVTLISVGLLVKEDSESITVCADWNPDGTWRALQTYPRSGIKLEKRIKLQGGFRNAN